MSNTNTPALNISGTKVLKLNSDGFNNGVKQIDKAIDKQVILDNNNDTKQENSLAKYQDTVNKANTLKLYSNYAQAKQQLTTVEPDDNEDTIKQKADEIQKLTHQTLQTANQYGLKDTALNLLQNGEKDARASIDDLYTKYATDKATSVINQQFSNPSGSAYEKEQNVLKYADQITDPTIKAKFLSTATSLLGEHKNEINESYKNYLTQKATKEEKPIDSWFNDPNNKIVDSNGNIKHLDEVMASLKNKGIDTAKYNGYILELYNNAARTAKLVGKGKNKALININKAIKGINIENMNETTANNLNLLQQAHMKDDFIIQGLKKVWSNEDISKLPDNDFRKVLFTSYNKLTDTYNAFNDVVKNNNVEEAKKLKIQLLNDYKEFNKIKQYVLSQYSNTSANIKRGVLTEPDKLYRHIMMLGSINGNTNVINKADAYGYAIKGDNGNSYLSNISNNRIFKTTYKGIKYLDLNDNDNVNFNDRKSLLLNYYILHSENPSKEDIQQLGTASNNEQVKQFINKHKDIFSDIIDTDTQIKSTTSNWNKQTQYHKMISKNKSITIQNDNDIRLLSKPLIQDWDKVFQPNKTKTARQEVKDSLLDPGKIITNTRIDSIDVPVLTYPKNYDFKQLSPEVKTSIANKYTTNPDMQKLVSKISLGDLTKPKAINTIKKAFADKGYKIPPFLMKTINDTLTKASTASVIRTNALKTNVVEQQGSQLYIPKYPDGNSNNDKRLRFLLFAAKKLNPSLKLTLDDLKGNKDALVMEFNKELYKLKPKGKHIQYGDNIPINVDTLTEINNIANNIMTNYIKKKK